MQRRDSGAVLEESREILFREERAIGDQNWRAREQEGKAQFGIRSRVLEAQHWKAHD